MKPEDLEILEVKGPINMYGGDVMYIIARLKVEGGFIYYYGNHTPMFVPSKEGK